MYLFEKYLLRDNESNWVHRALTDNSYKKVYERENGKKYTDTVNTDLATYGDSIIRFCFLEIMFDKVDELSNEKSIYESDKYLIEKVAEHYGLLEYMRTDKEDPNRPKEYICNDDSTKYIATAVEAMIGAIYKETNDLKPIVELLDSWRRFW